MSGLRTSFSPGNNAAAPSSIASYAVPKPSAFAAPTPTPGPIQYYAAHQTNYTSDVGTYQNSAATSYRLSDLHPNTQTYLQQLPSEWVQNSSPEQLDGLVRELEQFHSNLYDTLTINRPMLKLPSVVPPVVPPALPNPTIVYLPGNAPDTTTAPPPPPNDVTQAKHESTWYDKMDIGEAMGAFGGVTAGVKMIQKYATVIGEDEASEAVGSALVDSLEAPIADTILEGAGAAAIDVLGGAAAVGGFIAGGEIIAGVGIIGLGLYEGYKALGGTPIGGEVEDKIASGFKSGVSAFENFLHWP